MFSDIEFFLSIDRAAKAISQNSRSPVYRYHYVHSGFMSLPRMMGLSPHIDFGAVYLCCCLNGFSCFKFENTGVSHADENFLIFKCKLAPPMSSEDKNMSTILIDLWTSFAKNGYFKSYGSHLKPFSVFIMPLEYLAAHLLWMNGSLTTQKTKKSDDSSFWATHQQWLLEKCRIVNV